MTTAIKSIASGIGGLFSTPKIKTPEINAPVALPDPNSAAARSAAVAKLRQRAKKGREGTIYSQSYSNANLAGTA